MFSSQPEADGTIDTLTPGSCYQILQSFTDYDGNRFNQGEVLHFQERHFLPYAGGHTIVFTERSLYLQEEVNADILAHFSAYLGKVI